jgi:NADH/F420H2 dehydrogenase subunit C
MNNDQLKETILQWLPEAEFPDKPSQFLNVVVMPEQLRQLAEKLRYTDDMLFDFLFCLTGVDWTTHLMVVYHLASTKHGHEIVMKVKIPDRENPEVSTVCDIWRTAEFHEREVYDLFGVKFTNHPDLRRILLEDDWIGYPMRKDYKDEANIVEL